MVINEMFAYKSLNKKIGGGGAVNTVHAMSFTK